MNNKNTHNGNVSALETHQVFKTVSQGYSVAAPSPAILVFVAPSLAAPVVPYPVAPDAPSLATSLSSTTLLQRFDPN